MLRIIRIILAIPFGLMALLMLFMVIYAIVTGAGFGFLEYSIVLIFGGIFFSAARLVYPNKPTKTVPPHPSFNRPARQTGETTRWQITYGSPSDHYTTRDIKPLVTRSDNDGDYLIAHCYLRDAQRTFRINEIEKLVDMETGETVEQAHLMSWLRHNGTNLFARTE